VLLIWRNEQHAVRSHSAAAGPAGPVAMRCSKPQSVRHALYVAQTNRPVCGETSFVGGSQVS
jgi:hypothetical protein